ncbi:MAG: sulfatase, partial [Verrucomicrobiota bacterium]
KISLILAISLITTKADKAHNVLFVAKDDLNDRIGPMGWESAYTPHMDRLAANGVTFLNAHTGGIYCAPSRSAIFTGRYAPTTGCYRNQPYFHQNPELRPLQVAFQEAGYLTYGAGKLFHHPAGYVDLRGWDEFFVRAKKQRETGWPLNSWDKATLNTPDSIAPNPYPNSIYNKEKVRSGSGWFLEWGKVKNENEEKMTDTIWTNWAANLLKQTHDRPFFVGVGLYATHFPNYAPEKYFDLYDRDSIVLPQVKDDDLDDLPENIRKIKTRRKAQHHEYLLELGAWKDALHGYMACISYVDAMLGRMLDALAEGPNADNTIVVLWSDHGYHQGEKGDWGKHTLWQRTSGVPFIWSGPGVADGEVIDATVSLVDMYPTFIDVCGLEQDKGLEGASLAQALEDPSKAEDRNVLMPGMEPNEYAIINQDWRYIRYKNGDEELYHVRKDFHEWNNLAEDPRFDSVKATLQAAAPKTFAKPDNSKLQLVTEGESFHWKKK